MVRTREGKVIGIFSAKGGVGKTTTVANLGAALAQKLKDRVVIVETNMTASNLGLHLGILDPPVVIQDVAFGRLKVDEAISTTKYGLHIVPGSPAFTEEVASLDLRGILEKLRSMYDIILIDSAPGFGSEVFASIKACDEVLVICRPRVPAIAGTLQTFRMIDRFKVQVLGVVLNMNTGKRYEIPIRDIRRTLGWTTLTVIPDDDAVPESVTRGIPVVLNAPNSPAGTEFRKLAGTILDHLKARKRVVPSRKHKPSELESRKPAPEEEEEELEEEEESEEEEYVAPKPRRPKKPKPKPRKPAKPKTRKSSKPKKPKRARKKRK